MWLIYLAEKTGKAYCIPFWAYMQYPPEILPKRDLLPVKYCFRVFPRRLPILLRIDLNRKKGYNNNISRTFFLVKRTDTVCKFQRHNYTVELFEKDPIQIQSKSLMITIRKVKTI
jgi:hypothetical protein